jgi:hypothetical protein
LLLSPSSVPAGTYTKIEFLVDKTVSLVSSSTGAASTAAFPNALDGPTVGLSKLSLNLSTNLTVPGLNRLAIDFDLARWNVAGGVITPVLSQHSGIGLDDKQRHERFEFKGLIGDLSGTAPIQTFSLSLRSGGTVTVETSDATDFVGEGAVTALANGRKVEVYGTFDPATRRIIAKVIKIENAFENEAKAIGIASNPDSAAGTLKIMPKFTRGFAPQGETLNVVTNANTRYKGRRGAILTKAQFFEAFTGVAGANPVVQAEGAYDLASNTMTAKSLHIESEAGFGEASARGVASNPNLAESRFALALTSHEGFSPPPGLPNQVVRMLPTAEYKDQLGETITKDSFFQAIGARERVVDVEGTYADGVIVARKAKLRA